MIPNCVPNLRRISVRAIPLLAMLLLVARPAPSAAEGAAGELRGQLCPPLPLGGVEARRRAGRLSPGGGLVRSPAVPSPGVDLASARSLLLARRHQEALAAYFKLLRRSPRDGRIRLAMARLHSWLGNHRAARQCYWDVLILNPLDARAYRGLGDVARWSGKGAGAIRWYREYLRLGPGDPEVLRSLARTSMSIGDRKGALRSYEQLLTRRPRDREAGRHLQIRTGKPPREPRFSAVAGMTWFVMPGRPVWYRPKVEVGARPLLELWLHLGLEGRIRAYDVSTLTDVFISGTAIWTPPRVRGLTISATAAGSPGATFAPRFYLELNPEMKLGIFQAVAGYRYYDFPNRQSHVLMPGLSVHLGRVVVMGRYYFSLGLPFGARHYVEVRLRWQALGWLIVQPGGGVGDALDYLMETFAPPPTGPAAGSDTAWQLSFHISLALQFVLSRSKRIFVSWAYREEAVEAFPGAPVGKFRQHSLSAAFRWVI